jgi:hypothetical protein
MGIRKGRRAYSRVTGMVIMAWNEAFSLQEGALITVSYVRYRSLPKTYFT